MALLHIQGLEKRFGGSWPRRTSKHALRGVDLSIEKGAAFGLIGLNGAGKTTLIKTILAVLKPTRGEVLVFGAPPERVEVRRKIGYLPERLDFPKGMTPISFLRSVARFKGIAKGGDHIERHLTRVGLHPHASGRVDRFSKGMRQRLGLAAAFLGEPQLLILDEPTDGLDPLGRAQIRNLLLEEQRRGVTIFLNSHLLAETEKICDRVGILHEGRLILEGPLRELAQVETAWRLTPVPGTEAGLAQLEGEGVSAQIDGSYRMNAPTTTELNRTLDRLRALGVELSELRKETRDLESILAERVQ